MVLPPGEMRKASAVPGERETSWDLQSSGQKKGGIKKSRPSLEPVLL
jgi:hypothetical protein